MSNDGKVNDSAPADGGFAQCGAEVKRSAGGYTDWATCTRARGHAGNHADSKSYTRHEWAQIPERLEPVPDSAPAINSRPEVGAGAGGHPAPWAWDGDGRLTSALRDANGTALVFGQCVDPAVREIVADAPEMEALLREARDTDPWENNDVHELGLRCSGEWMDKVKAVLARIDAAKAGG